MPLTDSLALLRRFLAAPDTTGAVASSSRSLAQAIVAPFAGRTAPAHVLELGAGTGAFTREIGRLLGDEDRLDICEMQPELCDILEQDVLSRGRLGDAFRQDRVRLIRGTAEEIGVAGPYDFVISGLPFTSFDVAQVERVVEVVRSTLRPGGTFSYFEYVGLRSVRCTFAVADRDRLLGVSRLLDRLNTAHQVTRDTVWWNLPPAHARHWVVE